MRPAVSGPARHRRPSNHRTMARTSRLCVLLLCLCLTACAVQEKRQAVTYDSIPTDAVPSAAEIAYGKRMLRYVLEDYPGNVEDQHQTQLDATFKRLAGASGLVPEEWHVQLLHAPKIARVRAVEGNYLFVWSGLFDVIDSEDELAGLLACEMAHLLAGHAEPARFTPASELLFGLADIALTVGLGVVSQGTLNLGGNGITRSIFIDVNDLDALDRTYTPAQLEEMAPIAALILEASGYSPAGLFEFWRRADDLDPVPEELAPLVREVPPAERLAILEAAMAIEGIPPDDESTYADEPVQAGGADEATPGLGSNESGTDTLPGTSG